MLNTAKAFKGLLYDVLSRLSKNLNCYVIGNEIFLDKCAKKLILGIGCRGKSDLYLLKAKLNEKLKKLNLFLKAHRNDD